MSFQLPTDQQTSLLTTLFLSFNAPEALALARTTRKADGKPILLLCAHSQGFLTPLIEIPEEGPYELFHEPSSPHSVLPLAFLEISLFPNPTPSSTH